MSEPFFGCEITDRVYDSYFDQTADLHYSFQQAVRKNYYFFDLSDAKDNVVELQKADQDEIDNAAYWPQVGFFSRSHTTRFNLTRV
jgi:hypothetical protein